MPSLDIAAESRIEAAPMKKTSLLHRGSLALTALLLALAGIPFFYLFQRASEASGSEISALLFREKTLSIFFNTFSLIFLVSLGAVLIGAGFATLLYAVKIKRGALFLLLATLPLAIPSYVFTYSWIAIFPWFRGIWAAALVLTFSTMPYIFLATYAALRRVDLVQIEVARSLGFNRLEVFTKIVLPQIRGAIGASLLLVILYVLSDFGAVSLLGVDTFTRTIQNLYKASFDRQSAAILGLILMFIAATIILIEERVHKKNIASNSSVRVQSSASLITKPMAKLASLSLIVIYSFLALALPAYVLTTRMIANFQGIDYPALASATFNTLLVSTFGAIIAIAFALPLSWTIIATRSRFALFTEKVVLITHALPGVVLGLSLVAFGSKISWLYQSVGLLSFAYALLFLAKAVGNTRASMEKIPPILKEVSLTLGVSPLSTFRKITLPLAAPGIWVGFLLVLLTAMKELPATLMLRPTGFETLAVEIWSASTLSQFNQAAPYAFTLIALAAIPTFILSRPDRIQQESNHVEKERWRE